MNSKTKCIVRDTGRCKSKRIWFFAAYEGCFRQTYHAFLHGAYNAWQIHQSRSVEPFNESRLHIIQVKQELCPALGVYCSCWNVWKFYVSVLFQPQIVLDSSNIQICFCYLRYRFSFLPFQWKYLSITLMHIYKSSHDEHQTTY